MHAVLGMINPQQKGTVMIYHVTRCVSVMLPLKETDAYSRLVQQIRQENTVEDAAVILASETATASWLFNHLDTPEWQTYVKICDEEVVDMKDHAHGENWYPKNEADEG